MINSPAQPLQIAFDESTTSQAYQSALRAAVDQGNASATSQILSQLPADFILEESTIRHAIYSGPISILQALLAHDRTLANTDFDRYGTPLSVALQSKQPISTIRLLLSHGADPNVDPGTAPSSLSLAASFYDDPAVVSLLLEHGASTHRSWALPAAASAGKLDIVKYLLAQGLDPNGDAPEVGEGATRGLPLHLAVRKGHGEICQALLFAGADPMLEDGKGQRAIDIARDIGKDEMFQEWCLRAAATSKRAIS